MKKLLIGIAACCMLAILISGCSDDKEQAKNQLIVGVSADYPPFEFKQGEKFKGLDIDLANLIGEQLKKKNNI